MAPRRERVAHVQRYAIDAREHAVDMYSAADELDDGAERKPTGEDVEDLEVSSQGLCAVDSVLMGIAVVVEVDIAVAKARGARGPRGPYVV